MERQATILITIIFFLSILTKVEAQSQDCQFLDFYLNGDMTSWENEVDRLNKRDYKTFTAKELYDLCKAEYGLIGYLTSKDKDDKAEDYLDEAEKHIDHLLKLAPKNAEYLSMKAAFTAFEISISPYKAMYKGPESMSYIQDAMEISTSEPSIWIELGNSKFYTPKMFGGDKEGAIEDYKKAIRLMEQQDKTKCNWLYPHTLALLGTFYLETSDKKNAKVQFEKCLKLFPDFKWVKNELILKVD
jgi:tetratricopeptide (TPR) repeat protein